MHGVRWRPPILLLAAALWACGGSEDPGGDGGKPSPTTGTIVGSVTDGSGAPLAAVEIDTEPASGSALTGADGGYTLAGVAPGTYQVRAAKTGYVAATKTGVAVTAGGTAYADLRLETDVVPPQPGSIRVTVEDGSTGTGLAGATVRLAPGGRSLVTGADGGAVFRAVDAGGYQVSAERTGFLAADPVAVTVTDGAEATAAITLDPVPTVGRIAGVIRADGEPVAGASISTEPATLTATSAADGAYALDGLAPGAYVVKVAADGYHPAASAAVSVVAGETAGVDVTLEALPVYRSQCEACHLVRETLVADLELYPPPEGGEPESTGEG